MAEHYILINTDGKWAISRARRGDNHMYSRFKADLDPSEIDWPPLQLGLKVEALVPEGKEIRWPATRLARHGEHNSHYMIEIGLRPIEPPEPTGVEFLKTLPVGTTWTVSGTNLTAFVILQEGIGWLYKITPSAPTLVEWKDVVMDWVPGACPETLLPWTPPVDTLPG